MPPPFVATTLTVRDLLGDRHQLSVPSYQRAYAWSPAQAGQLLEDLLQALEDAIEQSDQTGLAFDGDYFLGAVVLMETSSEAWVDDADSWCDAVVHYEIVDGLQRLLTLTILMAVLRDIAEDEDAEASALAASCIVRADRPDTLTDERRRLRLRLEGSDRNFLHTFVQEARATSAMPDDDVLPPSQARILAVREHLVAALIGESAERRRDLLDFLLERCHCAVIAARGLDRAHQIFAVLNDRGLPLTRGDILKSQFLGAIGLQHRPRYQAIWVDIERRLGGSLDELLSHLRTIEGRSRGRIIDDIRALVDKSGGAETFITHTLQPYGLILEAVQRAQASVSETDDPLARRIAYLGWLGSHDWVAPLLFYWRLVDGDPGRLGPFVARLDRLSYGLRLLGIGSDKRAVRFKAVIASIRTATIDAGGNPLDLTRDEQRLILHNLRSLHSRSQLVCKLILLRLNDEIAGGAQRLDPAAFTVEHVLPQKPARSSEWRAWFPVAETRERCTQSLGNFILVSRQKNEQARNLDLALKLQIYFGDGEAQPHITRDIQSITRWGPDDVKQREERLLGLLTQMWQISGGRGGVTTADPGVSAPVLAAGRRLGSGSS